MANHKISDSLVTKVTQGPSSTKITQVANLQNYIQELLGETHYTFLQGSYKNSTAISDINDVDIVAVRKTTYSSRHSSYRFNNSISWDAIFSEIEEKLRNQKRYKDWNIERGDKCIKITGAFNADVVPAVQITSDAKTDPIAVYSFRTGDEKINSPRTHYLNGVKKHSLTSETYKPTVRMFKNWAKNNFTDPNIVSSFQIEALVHSVNNEDFFTDYPATFCIVGSSIVGGIKNTSPLSGGISSVCGEEDITLNWDPRKQSVFAQALNESVEKALKAYKATSQLEADTIWRSVFNN